MSRGQGPHGGDSSGALGRGSEVRLNRRGADDGPGTGIGQANVKPGGLAGTWIAIREVEQGRRSAAPSPHPRPHLHAALAEGARQLNALRIPLLDDDGVAAELGGKPMSGTTDQQEWADRRDDTRHCTMRRAPTHRATHPAPSESCASSRDNLTPVFEL